MLRLIKYLRWQEWVYLAFAVIFIAAKVYVSLLIPDYTANITRISQDGVLEQAPGDLAERRDDAFMHLGRHGLHHRQHHLHRQASRRLLRTPPRIGI